MSFNFSALPFDLQLNTLLELPIPVLSQICQTNSTIRNLCRDERLWKKKLLTLTNSAQKEISPALASTWREKAELFWNLLDPKICVTVVFDSEYTNNKTILGNYLVETEEESYVCLVKDYNKKIEPVYSVIKSEIKRWYDQLKDLYVSDKEKMLIKSIYEETKPLTVDFLRNFLINNSDETYSYYNIQRSLLIDLDTTSNTTLNLFSRDVNNDIPILTITGLPENKFYIFLGLMIDYSDLFTTNELFTNLVHIDHILQYLDAILTGELQLNENYYILSGKLKQC